MIHYFPTRLIALVHDWDERNGGISLDDKYELADRAGVTLQEIEAAIAYTLDTHEEPNPRLTTTDYEEAP